MTIPTEVRELVIADRKAGKTVREVAALRDVSSGFVTQVCCSAGVTVRVVRERSAADLSRDRHILEMRTAGASIPEIARKYAVTKQRIHQILVRLKLSEGCCRGEA